MISRHFRTTWLWLMVTVAALVVRGDTCGKAGETRPDYEGDDCHYQVCDGKGGWLRSVCGRSWWGKRTRYRPEVKECRTDLLTFICRRVPCEEGDRRPDYGGDDCHYQECLRNGTWKSLECGKSWDRRMHYDEKEKKCKYPWTEFSCKKVPDSSTTKSPSVPTKPQPTMSPPTMSPPTGCVKGDSRQDYEGDDCHYQLCTANQTWVRTECGQAWWGKRLHYDPVGKTCKTDIWDWDCRSVPCREGDRRPDFGGDDCHYQECLTNGTWKSVQCDKSWDRRMHYNEKEKQCKYTWTEFSCKRVPDLRTSKAPTSAATTSKPTIQPTHPTNSTDPSPTYGCMAGDRRPDYGGDSCHYQECQEDGSWKRINCDKSWGRSMHYNEKEKQCKYTWTEFSCKRVPDPRTSKAPTSAATTSKPTIQPTHPTNSTDPSPTYGCVAGDRRPDYGGDSCHYQECQEDGSWKRINCDKSWGRSMHYDEEKKKCKYPWTEFSCKKVPNATTTAPTVVSPMQ